jgi:pepF/M3 family oligoendopeptidase
MSEQLPHWNTTSLFPSLESGEFETAFKDIFARVERLENICNSHKIEKLETAPSTEAATQALEAYLNESNAFSKASRLVSGFISCFTSTDSRNDLAQAKTSELQLAYVRSSKLATRFQAWLSSLDLNAILEISHIAKDHKFALLKSQTEARHQMTPLEEDLAASLTPSGSSAWAKLHGNITSRLIVQVSNAVLPMSAVRGLARDKNAVTREDAFRAELEAWETVSVPLAAALNSIKGEVNVKNQRRGFIDSLEPSLNTANIDRETLNAMHAACVASFPDFRRYFKAKAKLLGRKHGLLWCDLFAPVGTSSSTWSYFESIEFVASNFGTYSQKLEDFARDAFNNNWVDAEPRNGKRDGAFCMGVRDGESRILMNFEPSLDSVSTLAHELGHGYHNFCLKDRTPWQRQTPMTLAETASIFCETIIMKAALSKAASTEKLGILENDIQGHAQVVVDIHSRFLFESRLFAAREKRELSVEELKNLMLEAQLETYGDGLDPNALHPYMWAVKGHYYSGGLSYYNYPYTFGLLFGLGLYAKYQQDPEQFKASYDDLLSSTGLADAATLGTRFGIDTRDTAFWTSSLDQIRGNINEFVALVG